MKVKVRIAVAVDEDGEWLSCGASWISPITARESVCSSLRKYFRWIEAELDVPEVKTVQGDVVEVK